MATPHFVDAARRTPPTRARPPGEWQPLPLPTLLRDLPRNTDGTLSSDASVKRNVSAREGFGWVGTLGWGFALLVVLLVIAPTDSIPKLIGPSQQPVSASGYGPLVAMFAVGAVVVAVCGCFWLWAAMSRERDSDHDDSPTSMS